MGFIRHEHLSKWGNDLRQSCRTIAQAGLCVRIPFINAQLYQFATKADSLFLSGAPEKRAYALPIEKVGLGEGRRGPHKAGICADKARAIPPSAL
jgi:hypothetical protein